LQETISYDTSVESAGGVIMNERRPNIGLVTTFGRESGTTPLLNLAKVLSSLSDKLYVLCPSTTIRSSGNVHLYPIGYNPGGGIFAQVRNQVSFQLRLSYQLAGLIGKVKLWVFFGGEGLLLPMLTAKLFRGKVVLSLAGYLEKEGEFKKNVLYKPLSLLKRINCRLAYKIVIYSQRLIKEWRLEGHKGKIVIAHEHFLDFSTFKLEKPLPKRDKIVGYIGDLIEYKGIRSLLESIPKVLEKENNLKFLIVGDGKMQRKIEHYLSGANLSERVSLMGWVPHEEIPKHLNDLYLLVLPSYTEGMPNIMLEAMACGTPVLATPVGAIPDVVKDGETGFIMENNSPKCIAENIVRAVNHPNLEQIARNAQALVEREFTYEAAVEGYRRILNRE
jgi:glycosyltransferase involved in cell wall biosynthesis